MVYGIPGAPLSHCPDEVGPWATVTFATYFSIFWRENVGVSVHVIREIRETLGGGNSNIFYVHPDPWGNDQIWLAYFSTGLKPPTRTVRMLKYLSFASWNWLYMEPQSIQKISVPPCLRNPLETLDEGSRRYSIFFSTTAYFQTTEVL